MKNPSLADIHHQVKSIWEVILGIEIDNFDENFFMLGGSSIQAFESVTSINERFGINMDIADFFETLNIKHVSEWIQKNG